MTPNNGEYEYDLIGGGGLHELPGHETTKKELRELKEMVGALAGAVANIGEVVQENHAELVAIRLYLFGPHKEK